MRMKLIYMDNLGPHKGEVLHEFLLMLKKLNLHTYKVMLTWGKGHGSMYPTLTVVEDEIDR